MNSIYLLILLHINVFTVTFGQFNVLLLKKVLISVKKEILFTPNLWTPLYVAISINIEINKYCKYIFILSESYLKH